jgi:hypothetical protein
MLKHTAYNKNILIAASSDVSASAPELNFLIDPKILYFRCTFHCYASKIYQNKPSISG